MRKLPVFKLAQNPTMKGIEGVFIEQICSVLVSLCSAHPFGIHIQHFRVVLITFIELEKEIQNNDQRKLKESNRMVLMSSFNLLKVLTEGV